MGDYADVFFAIEHVVFAWWESNPRMNDEEVLCTYRTLARKFDGQKEGTLPSEIEKSIKTMLIARKRKGERDYTFGELLSCIDLLIGLVRQHESSDGIGYLKWIKLFFEGRLPEPEEGLEYILKNEM